MCICMNQEALKSYLLEIKLQRWTPRNILLGRDYLLFLLGDWPWHVFVPIYIIYFHDSSSDVLL